MNKEQEALRRLEEACKLKKDCKFGTSVYRFASYDKRGNIVYIELTDKKNRSTTIDRNIEMLHSFMERAEINELDEYDGIIKLDDLVMYVRGKHGRTYIKEDCATVWMSYGNPNKVVFSRGISENMVRTNPSGRYSVSFLLNMIILIPSETNFITANKRRLGRVGIVCHGFHDKIKFRRYNVKFKEIESILCVVLTGVK